MGIVVKVSEWGNSLAIRLPKAVAEQLGLSAGDEAEIELNGASARFAKTRAAASRTRYAEMIAEMKRLQANGIKEPDLVDWGPPIGDEIIKDKWTGGSLDD